MSKAVKRSYVSARRAAQAMETRQSVLAAALQLFTTRGYGHTTIQSVADEAGVAVQTVYAVFGNKRELLRQVLESAVTGDALPVPVTARPELRAMLDDPDPRRRAEVAAAMVTQISRRIAPVAKVLREAATVDDEFATTAREVIKRRRSDLATAARTLCGPNLAKAGLEQILGTLYVLYSPETFLALTEDLGWSIQTFERWLAEMLHRTVTESR